MDDDEIQERTNYAYEMLASERQRLKHESGILHAKVLNDSKALEMTMQNRDDVDKQLQDIDTVMRIFDNAIDNLKEINGE